MTNISGISQVTANRFHTSTQGYQTGFLTCQSSTLKKRLEW